jgi:hypothetical protein
MANGDMVGMGIGIGMNFGIPLRCEYRAIRQGKVAILEIIELPLLHLF